MRSWPALVALAAALSAPRSASADPDYPAAIVKHLELMVKPPACTICHRASADPVGPADSLFAKALIARGLVTKNEGSLATALDKMRTDDVDSDGDGARDLDELSWGGDPNVADLPVGGAQLPPTYGCATAPRSTDAFAPMAMLAALGLARVRRRRREPRKI